MEESDRTREKDSTWPTCSRDRLGVPCGGIRVGRYSRCWAHLDDEEVQRALDRLKPHQDLDARGTTIDTKLFAKLVGGPRREIRNTVRFDQAEFPEIVMLVGTKFKKDVVFDDAHFNAEAVFLSVDFGGVAWFCKTRFEAVFFESVLFHQEASFDGASFDSSASFDEHTIFADKVSFDQSSFRYEAWFEEVLFRERALFNRARFAGETSFKNVIFCNDVLFNRVHVEDIFSMVSVAIERTLFLSHLRGSGNLRIKGDITNTVCTESAFNGSIWFSLEGGSLSLADSTFWGPVTVESALESVSLGELKEELFVDDLDAPDEELEMLKEKELDEDVMACESAREARMQTASFLRRVKLISLRGTDATLLTLIDADLSSCLMSGLKRPEQLRLDGRCIFTVTPGRWFLRWGWMPWRWMKREALYEEHLWRNNVKGIGAGWVRAPSYLEGRAIGPERLAVLYRQLRKAVEDSRNEPGAADFYYGEMEMRRIGSTRTGERWLLSVYWLVSGYGLRATRALVMLACLIVAATVGLQHGGFVGRAPDFLTDLIYVTGSVVSLNITPVHVPIVLTAWGEIVRIVLRIGGPVLLGLAALAIRSRVKR